MSGACNGGFHALSEARTPNPLGRGGGSGADRHVRDPVAHIIRPADRVRVVSDRCTETVLADSDPDTLDR